MTPEIYYYQNGDSAMVSFYYNQLLDTYIKNRINIRPVINLKSKVNVISGDGSESNPYVIE